MGSGQVYSAQQATALFQQASERASQVTSVRAFLPILSQAAQAAHTSLMVIGGGAVDGQGATSVATSWPEALKDDLRLMLYQQKGDYGVGFVPAARTTGNTSQASITGQQHTESVAGDWELITGEGGYAAKSVQLNSSNAEIVFSAQACEFITVHAVNSMQGNGAFTVTIDGGTPTTITTTADSPSTENTFSLDLGAPASNHQVTIGWVSGNPRIEGVSFSSDKAAGLTFYAAGSPGYTAQVAAANASLLAQAAAQAKPTLLILNLGTADMAGGTTPATYAANIATTISTVLAANPKMGVLFVHDPMRLEDARSALIEGQNNYPGKLSAYQEAVREALVSFERVSLFFIDDLWRPIDGQSRAAQDPFGWDNQNNYPSNLGHQQIADHITGVGIGQIFNQNVGGGGGGGVDPAELQAIHNELATNEQTIADTQNTLTATQTTLTQAQTDLASAQHDLYDAGGRVDTIQTTLTGQITTGDQNTLTEAANDAASRVSAAKSATLSAASADAAAKATQAQANATAAAAADAKAKADAAQQAAINAANTYAEDQINGASADTLAAAKADAESKADAAKAAAITAAALDAQAKADAAQAAATQDASEDATAKANAAKQAAIDAVGPAIAQAQSQADDALTAAQQAQATADGTVNTYYQADPPWANGSTQPAANLGDMWYESDTGMAYRWSGTEWVAIQDNQITAALAAASQAQATADGKITAYYQDTRPTTGDVDDLWYDTSNGNKPHYCSDISPLTWTPIQDGAIAAGDAATLASAATAAQTKADAAKTAAINAAQADATAKADAAQAAAAAAAATDAQEKADAAKQAAITAANAYAAAQASGASSDAIAAAAEDAQNKADAAQAAAIAAAKADATAKADAAEANATSVAAADATQKANAAQQAAIDAVGPAIAQAQDAATSALTAAQQAQATADGAINTYYQADAPWPNGSTQPDTELGDMWYSSTDGQAYRWDGTNWVIIEDNQVAAALAAAQGAQSTADGKITAYYQSTKPTKGDVDDLWYDTGHGNKPYYCSSASPLTWTAIQDASIAAGDTATLSAAAADAGSKATAAQQAAILAAAADATAKADKARSDATAAAATDAQSKADAAQAAAEAAANQYAQDQINGASADTLAAAKADAQAKATAAQQAAEAAAAADATAKANAAETAAAQAAADDATSKANAAKQAAIDALTPAITGANTLANNALTAAQKAQSTADGAINTYYQDTAPWANGSSQPATVVGDMWYESDTGQAYRWDGTRWNVIEDNQIAVALGAAQGAQATADGKITAYYQGTQPTTGDLNDLWFDTSNGNKPYYCSKLSPLTWSSAQDASIAKGYQQNASRGTDLVLNGTGILGDNTNFSQFTYSSDAPAGAAGSFLTSPNQSQTLFSDESIGVDPAKHYRMSVQVKENSGTDSRFYVGLVPYDISGSTITPAAYAYRPNTDTTLAADLNPGDTTVTLTNAAGWDAGTNSYVTAWNYQDPNGRVWPVHTYTRWYQKLSSITGNVVTLSSPWNSPKVLKGATVSNGLSGGSYMYCCASNALAVSGQWNTFTSNQDITGVQDGANGGASFHFPPGCAFVKLLILANRNGDHAQQSYASFSFSDVNAAQVAAQSAQDTADTAQVTADGKNAVFWGTASTPTGNGVKDGDVWYQYQIVGGKTTILKMWKWEASDSVWKPQALDEQFIPQLNIGTGTYGSLDGARLQANSVIANNILVQSSVGTTLIADGAITTTKIVSNSITGDKIVGNTITGDKIAGKTITGDLIAGNTISGDKIVGNTITGDKISGNTITGALIVANAITTDKIDAGAVTASKIAVNTITADRLAAHTINADVIDASSIAAAVGTFVKVSATNILAGNITAQLGISTGGALIATDSSGAQTVLDPTGLYIKVPLNDGTGGTAVATQLSGAGQSLVLYDDPTQDPTAQISSLGDASFNTVNSAGDMLVNGIPLMGQMLDPASDPGLLDGMAEGVVAFGNLQSVVSPVDGLGPYVCVASPGSYVNVNIAYITFTADPTRTYGISLPYRFDINDAVSGALVRAGVTIKYETAAQGATPAVPTDNSSTLCADTRSYATNSGGDATTLYSSLYTTWSPNSSGPISVTLLVQLSASGCTMSTSPGGAATWQLNVLDVGVNMDDSAVALQPPPVGGGTQPPPTKPPKKTYTTSWVANYSRCFQSNGSAYDFFNGKNYLGQGQSPAGYGNLRSAIDFSGIVASGGDEKGKYLTGVLAGAKVTRVRLRLTSRHWYIGAGGTAVIRPTNQVGTPSNGSNPSSTSKSQAFTGQTQTRWIDLPTSWIAADKTGVWLGPGISSSYQYYGYFSGYGVSGQPALEVTYTR